MHQHIAQRLVVSIGAIMLAVSAACASDGPFQLTSPAFTDGQTIPANFTCAGHNSSPPLAWSGAPMTTRSFALVLNDPDAPAGDWVHWVIYNIPATDNALAEDIPHKDKLPNGVLQGMNSFGHIGYNGPCPPAGPSHRYFIHFYALDTLLDLKPKATREELKHACAGHILAEAQFMGTFQKK